MNSRLRISNQLELAEQVKTLVTRAAQQGTRAVLFVANPPVGWLAHCAQRCQSTYLDANSAIDRADRISALLGSERFIIVIQLGTKPDLGLIAAAAGTVRAGGLVIIGTSEPCTTTSRINIHLDVGSHSNRRLQRLAFLSAEQHPDTIRYIEVSPGIEQTMQATDQTAFSTLSSCLRASESLPLNPNALAEQNALFNNACHHLNAHLSSCIVIKGRRGRGKSSLLARLAMHLDDISVDFRITALHESALSAYRKHTDRAIYRYVSPESACEEAVDVLLVEEAASISLKQLQRFLDQFRHVILCTTVDGYEASGRAFDIRLFSDWPSKSMALLQLDANKPWRWADDDPLEQFTDQLLLNNDAIQTKQLERNKTLPTHIHGADCQISRVSQHQLANDEPLLASVHALLHNTHYQTTTKDLENLLDAPTVQLWTQKLDNTVVGVLMLEQEGAIDKTLHEAILTKKRRLPNQLLPQLLAQTANTSAALGKKYLRIIRIAVIPELRRRKLASQLLQAVTIGYSEIDAIGASFAADQRSMEFWLSHEYTEFHRGFRSNPRTGRKAAALIKSFEPTTADVLSTASQIHRENELARESKLPLNSDRKASSSVSVRDIQLLHRFADGQRSQHDTFASLQRLSLLIDVPIHSPPALSIRQHELELRRYVQQWLGLQSKIR